MIELSMKQRQSIEDRLSSEGFRHGLVVFTRVNDTNVLFGATGVYGNETYEMTGLFAAEQEQAVFDRFVGLTIGAIRAPAAKT